MDTLTDSEITQLARQKERFMKSLTDSEIVRLVQSLVWTAQRNQSLGQDATVNYFGRANRLLEVLLKRAAKREGRST